MLRLLLLLLLLPILPVEMAEAFVDDDDDDGDDEDGDCSEANADEDATISTPLSKNVEARSPPLLPLPLLLPLLVIDVDDVEECTEWRLLLLPPMLKFLP